MIDAASPEPALDIHQAGKVRIVVLHYSCVKCGHEVVLTPEIKSEPAEAVEALSELLTQANYVMQNSPRWLALRDAVAKARRALAAPDTALREPAATELLDVKRLRAAMTVVAEMDPSEWLELGDDASAITVAYNAALTPPAKEKP